jgi:hypothetical protein
MHCAETGQPANRRFARRRLFRAGVLVKDSQRWTCLIRDISPQGAQIRIDASQLLPDQGYLIDLKGRAVHRAYPIWRKGSLTGLRLAESFMMTSLPAHLARLGTAREP